MYESKSAYTDPDCHMPCYPDAVVNVRKMESGERMSSAGDNVEYPLSVTFYIAVGDRMIVDRVVDFVSGYHSIG